MKDRRNNKKGFSLTEILMAVGTLAIGMLFIAGVFPAGILFSTQATERTIAAIVADEAFAMVKILAAHPSAPVYNHDFSDTEQAFFDDVADNTRALAGVGPIADNNFAYPLTDYVAPSEQRYFWSAICRRTGPDADTVQVTVFVCRRGSPSTEYWVRNPATDELGPAVMPRPVYVEVVPYGAAPTNQVEIQDFYPSDGTDEASFVGDGSIVVDDISGRLYRVLRREREVANRLTLDRSWEGGTPALVWVVPPAVGGGRYPCIAVFQKVIKF